MASLTGERFKAITRGLAAYDPPRGLGRIREVISAPDGELWATTSNCDGRGECGPEKDRVVRIVPAAQ